VFIGILDFSRMAADCRLFYGRSDAFVLIVCKTVCRLVCIFFQNTLTINHKETQTGPAASQDQTSHYSTAAQQSFMATLGSLPGRAK
jgi:hypothetical protein